MGAADPDRKIPRRRRAVALSRQPGVRHGVILFFVQDQAAAIVVVEHNSTDIEWPQLFSKGRPVESRGPEAGLNVWRLLGDKCLMAIRGGEGHANVSCC